MSTRYDRLLGVLLLVILVGCSAFPLGLGTGEQTGTLTPETTYMPANTHTPGAMQTQTLIATKPATSGTQIPVGQFLRIWLPPGFSPDEDNAAGALLNARLEQFEAENPNIQLEIRVKAVDGPGGLLDSLVAANAAAPMALPDLVLLPRPLLESATLKGLLYPYDDLTHIMDAPDWFEYARQLSQLTGRTYGVPFAGDLMLLAYSLPSQDAVPINLEETIAQKNLLLFPAADPQALFSLCLYLAQGGKLHDEQGRPALEVQPLENILDYYQRARLAEVVPYTMTQYADDSQVWEDLPGSHYLMAVTWSSSFLRNSQAGQENLAIAPLPTLDGVPFTLATGWSWAMASQDTTRRQISIRLVEYLIDEQFLAAWTQAAGYLPPRANALQDWNVDNDRQVFEQISYSAQLMPAADLISSVGPALQLAVMEVISGQRDAQTAAVEAVDQVNRP